MAHQVIDYPQEAYKNNPAPVPSSVSFGGIDPKNVILMPEGGVVFYPPNCPFPLKGLKAPHKIFASDATKKYLNSWLAVLSSPTHFVEQWFESLGDFCNGICRNYWLNEDKWYSPPVQEIRRVMLKMFGDTVRGERIAQTVAFILEMDRPYLHPLQDIFQLIDKNAAQKRPAKELRRILKILVERDKRRDWSKKVILINVIMILSPRARRLFRQFAAEINLEKMWFDEADLWACLPNGTEESGYNYLGLKRSERLKLCREIVANRIQKLKDEQKNVPI